MEVLSKEVAKDFAQDAFVNAVSSGAGSAAMKVTGNANFSRAVSLASGVAGGSKSGKVLNSLDDIGTSTVKSLNHLDDVKGVAKKNKGGISLGIDELVTRDPNFLNDVGDIDWEKWAPNGGRVPGTIKKGQTLDRGTIIDRYGNKYGKYTSPVGVPYEQRALPYIENANAYHKYKVIKPIDDVTTSKIAEAFEQPGGGIQYELPSTINQLEKNGFLKEIK